MKKSPAIHIDSEIYSELVETEKQIGISMNELIDVFLRGSLHQLQEKGFTIKFTGVIYTPKTSARSNVF